MIDKHAALGGVVLVGVLALAGCTSTNGGVTDGITYVGVRKAAVEAGPSPTACPIPFDVGAALPGRQVTPGDVDVALSKTTTPAPDPLTAQRDQGMSALDAAAGVEIDCSYEVDGKSLDAVLIAMPTGRGSIDLLAPLISRDAHLDVTQLTNFLRQQPTPGDVALTPGGDVAVAHATMRGSGDASLLVDPNGVVTGDALRSAARTLLGQIHV